MIKQKRSLFDLISNFATKISDPLARFAEIPAISAVQNGLVSIMPIIIVGSFFLIFYVFGSPSVGTSGHALIPFLEPLANKFVWINSVTLGFLSLYSSISISQAYAEKLKIDIKSAGLMGVMVFIVFTISGLDKAGGIPINSFSASGLFVCIATSLISVKFYSILLKKNVTIKMPASVPPNIGNAFASLIPYAVSVAVAWLIRDIINFDMVAWPTKVMSPLIQGADNLFVYVFDQFIESLFWTVGLHGTNMFTQLFTPFGTIWLEENAKALAASTVYNLPHVLAGLGQTGLARLTEWPASIWPLIYLMIRSKVKYLKALGWAALPAGIFTIIEPILFGLPVALNPFLIVPFILSNSISAAIGYLLMASSAFGKFYAAIPWATPPFILGPLGTGDWKTALIPIIGFFVGLVIYYPFWKQFEADCLRKEQEQEEAKTE
ncbi:PTS lactose/cellobiose family IIC subunit [Thermoanaerobacterium thermosaccharolyticum]|uniref:Permease IIC component n=1 Tax=Thermoanaerobacterium thermosaccharolyticum TaxID=1517 RepID=A0A231VCM8_THETR|nr:PTS transporter subunit EIIC [Thermoanaerobacterium thermosaccharolyticum]OXT05741.1 PTS lactose/cellobiose family IIC subunit [Thermoanaerobacterium thermosaccharolyticum]